LMMRFCCMLSSAPFRIGDSSGDAR
jgi:hypothetical protein